MEIKNQSAFPINTSEITEQNSEYVEYGLTKREYVEVEAMKALIPLCEKFDSPTAISRTCIIAMNYAKYVLDFWDRREQHEKEAKKIEDKS